MFSLISTAIGFLYPAYSSYKALSKRPVEDAELERWVMYWSILSALLTAEHVLPLLFYVPFYSLLRTFFLLFLVAPQTQGSTYLYRAYFEPFLKQHEEVIGGLVGKAKERGWAEGKKWGEWAWERILASLGAQGAQGAGAQGQATQGPGGVPVPPEGTIGASQPPTLASPLSGPAQMLGGLWRTYGPSLIATGAAFVQNQQANLARARTAGAGAATSSTSQSQPPVQGYEVEGATSGVSARSSEAQAQSNISQRRGGPPTPGASSSSAPGPGTPGSTFGTGPAFPNPQLPIPTPGQQSSPGHPSAGTGSTNGSGDERDRRYETISHEELEEHHEGEEAQKGQGGSWFPWSPGSKGYERVKSE